MNWFLVEVYMLAYQVAYDNVNDFLTHQLNIWPLVWGHLHQLAIQMVSNLDTRTKLELTAYQLLAYAYILYPYTPPQVGWSLSIFAKYFAFALGSTWGALSLTHD